CLQMFHERFQFKGLTTVLNLTDELVCVDVRRMEQVFIALFSNFLRYSNAGQINITTVTTTEHWVLTFEDEGPGINESHLEHLFKPFY
ncbi:two-component sensor histidine kinase AdeS, partial [bacterium LRH843]|nr:two-component sensor histidine kinase AdeS [bacterium LRH843]